MRLEVTTHYAPDGREFFYWTLWDGPDGIDEVTGFGCDLCEVFAKVIEWRERIARDYVDEFLDDMATVETFLQTNNETGT